jgi:hypothetical protein
MRILSSVQQFPNHPFPAKQPLGGHGGQSPRGFEHILQIRVGVGRFSGSFCLDSRTMSREWTRPTYQGRGVQAPWGLSTSSRPSREMETRPVLWFRPGWGGYAAKSKWQATARFEAGSKRCQSGALIAIGGLAPEILLVGDGTAGGPKLGRRRSSSSCPSICRYRLPWSWTGTSLGGLKGG